MCAQLDDDLFKETNADEDRAIRLLSLVEYFTNLQSPLSLNDIRLKFYAADMNDSALRKAFSRDRSMLAQQGIYLYSEKGPDGIERWNIDASASLAGESHLSLRESLILKLICQSFLFDETFPYSEELSRALTKIVHSFNDILPGSETPQIKQLSKPMKIVRDCFEKRKFVEIDYCSHGSVEPHTHVVAVLGFYGLRDHTYVVVSRVNTQGNTQGQANFDKIFRFRDDRIQKARPLTTSAPGSYEIPEDFFISDFRLLPFQIGENSKMAVFRVANELRSNVQRASFGKGHWEQKETYSLWSISFSDAQAAACWAIAEGIQPQEPSEVREAWEYLLEGASGGRRTLK